MEAVYFPYPMSDEPIKTDAFFEIPNKKTALEWGFRLLMLAAYFWATGHFLSIDRYEHDNEKQDAQRSILIEQLGKVNESLIHIKDQMDGNVKRDDAITQLQKDMRETQQKVMELQYAGATKH